VSLLGSIPGGKCLEPPINTNTRCRETREQIRDRIYAGLLPAQREFVDCTDRKIIGYVAGFGAGKTHSLCALAVLRALDNVNTVAAVFEPTHIMIRDVWVRSFDDYLDANGIDYDFRVSPQPEYRLHVPGGTVTLLCRATETYNRIRGQNLSYCIADEIDTSSAEIAQKATEMMLARLRGGKNPQLAVASTPEGFRWMYRTFVEAEDQSDRHLVRARTLDNPHLPPGFVDSLYKNYPPQLLAAYLEGQFTNLNSTTVYPYFDRDLHWTDTVVQPDDRLFIGIDFNVGCCFVEVCVRRGDEFHFIDEYHPKDTPSVVKKIQELYPDHIARGNVVVIPDAASRQRTTTNASESDLALLRKGGFTVKAQPANPALEDRINAMNVLMISNRFRVHTRCRYLIRSLETQAFDDKGRPDKSGRGIEDKSGPVDAAGYIVTALAGLRRYATGGSNFRTY
jgi:PBSX family phage terminase large subunit